MRFKVESWNVAFRKRNSNILHDSTPFTMIKHNYKGWQADPFLFEYENKVYLFVENYSYKSNRASIACAEYDPLRNCFSEFKNVIVEDYHLSYPVVFTYQDNIIMMPECSESGSLYFYVCDSFPYIWRKQKKVLDKVKVVDATPLIINGELYIHALKITKDTTGYGELTLYHYNNENEVFEEKRILTKDMSIARPGGNFFNDGDTLYRVAQDCSSAYGKSLSFMPVDRETLYQKDSADTVRTFMPRDVKLNVQKRITGVHTYNLSEQIEVIDVKRESYSIYHLICRVRAIVRELIPGQRG